MKTDCRDYGQRKLVMWFQNEEHLYDAMKHAFASHMSFNLFSDCYVSDNFLFYSDQLEELRDYYLDSKMDYLEGNF